MKKTAKASRKMNKLSLNKETVRDLSPEALRAVGGAGSAPAICYQVTGACTNFGCGETNTARCG